MQRWRWIAGITGLILFIFAVWRMVAAQAGLEVIQDSSAIPPVSFILPKADDLADRPLVLIGHGFAGSERLMRGFALTLAHAGYATVLWDFDGHGANPKRLSGFTDSEALQADAEVALAEAVRRGLGASGRVVILGHSMGSGVALQFGQAHPEIAAVIAVSPVGVTVTPELPHNLLLMAGSLEQSFVGNAQELLAQAGGAGGEPLAGNARKLVVIPGVEHITILFKPLAHATARQWLDAAFGSQPGAQDYTDRRLAWYGMAILGVILAILGLAPISPSPAQPQASAIPLWRRLAAMVGGAFGSTLLVWVAGLAGLQLPQLFGMLVGGYLILWFGLAGFLALLILYARQSWPSWKEAGLGLLIFGALWAGVGLSGDAVWLPWLLIPARLALWPLAALLFLPWFLAVGSITRGAAEAGFRPVLTPLWWVFQSLVIVGSLLLALSLTPGLFFLMLILPLFPLVLGIHAAATALQRSGWVFALSAALFTAWMVVAVFPLS